MTKLLPVGTRVRKNPDKWIWKSNVITEFGTVTQSGDSVDDFRKDRFDYQVTWDNGKVYYYYSTCILPAEIKSLTIEDILG